MNLEFQRDSIVRRIDHYRAVFGNNILLYDFDLFKKNPLSVLQAIGRFLEVPGCFDGTLLSDAVINASGRKNLKVLTYLQALLKYHRVFWTSGSSPIRKGLLLFRDMVDRYDTKPARKPQPSLSDKRYRAIAEKTFSGQRAAVAELFSRSKMILGSGDSFS